MKKTDLLKSILRKSFKSRKKFEDETTSHKRGILVLLFAKATSEIQIHAVKKNFTSK